MRVSTIQVRVSEEEKACIVERAASCGVKVSEYVRRAAMREAGKERDLENAEKNYRSLATSEAVEVPNPQEATIVSVGREPRRAGYGKGATLGGRESHQRVADVATCGNAPPAEMQARPIPKISEEDRIAAERTDKAIKEQGWGKPSEVGESRIGQVKVAATYRTDVPLLCPHGAAWKLCRYAECRRGK